MNVLVQTVGEKAEFLKKTTGLFCKDFNVEGFDNVLNGQTHNNAYFLNHGSMFSWAVIPSLLYLKLLENNMLDWRLGVIYHPIVKKVPVMNLLAKKLAGTTPVTHKEILSRLQNKEVNGYGTMPEAINCTMHWKEGLAPFRYNGLLLAALQSNSKCSLMVHKGTESWDRKIPFFHQLPLVEKVKLPFPVRPLNHVQIVIESFQPQITLDDCENYKKLPPRIKKRERSPVDVEGDRMRAEMLSIYKQL